MISNFDIIKAIVRTEKGTNVLEPAGKYIFWVDINANKLQIKTAVEDIYKVKVTGVNTQVCIGKQKRVRYHYGTTADWKKAIVTLAQGQKIDVT
jgi:large subunit ribosomal protein L23